MTQTIPDTASTAGPVGLGGWLILPLIGLVVTPIRGVAHLASYFDLFGQTDRLNTAQSAFIYAEFIGNLAVLLVLPIALLVLFFRKSGSFPKLFIVWAAAGLAFIIVDLFVAEAVFSAELAAAGEPLLDDATLTELGRSIFTAVVWIPYMRVSRRVANTFTN